MLDSRRRKDTMYMRTLRFASGREAITPRRATVLERSPRLVCRRGARESGAEGAVREGAGWVEQRELSGARRTRGEWVGREGRVSERMEGSKWSTWRGANACGAEHEMR